MTRTSLSSSCRGSSAVEVIIAVLLLSFIGLMGSQFLLASTRTLTSHRYRNQATALGDMVLQQYDNYAAQNYDLLYGFNVTRESPMVFFDRPDNFGYDGMDITTAAQFGQNQSSCTISVTIGWAMGRGRGSSLFTKVYTRTTSRSGGGLAQVTVKMPCSGYTQASDILANCPGIPLLAVSAPGSASVSTVSALTGNDGTAILQGIVLGSAVPFQITAPTPSDYTVAPASPGFTQGYAIWDSTRNIYTQSLIVTAPILDAEINKVAATAFQSAGQIAGTVTNSVDGTVNLMSIRLTNAWAAKRGKFQLCGAGDNNTNCRVQTPNDGSGSYAFYNVMPGALTLYADGADGSSPTVQYGAAGFQYAYTNPTPNSAAATDWNLTANPPLLTSPAISLWPLGWLVVQTSPLVAGATVWTTLPPTPFHSSRNVNLLTDPSGKAAFYNVVSTAVMTAAISGSVDPQGADLFGAFGQVNWSCVSCVLNAPNAVTLPLPQGYVFNGSFADSSGYLTRIVGMTVTVPTQRFAQTSSTVTYGQITVGSVTQSNFVLTGFTPGSFTNGSVTAPFPVTLSLIKAMPVSATITGQVTDAGGNPAGLPAAHAGVQFNTLNAANAIIPTVVEADANGQFSLSGSFPYSSNVTIMATCDPITFQCTASPPAPIAINTNNISVSWQNASGFGWQTNSGTQPILAGGSYTFPMTATLRGYKVQGTVTDAATGLPLANVDISEPNGENPIATTDNTGAYAGWASVQGRNNNNLGSISLQINGAQIGGTYYQGSSAVSQGIPNPPDPQAALTVNFQLTPGSAPSGGGSTSSGSTSTSSGSVM